MYYFLLIQGFLQIDSPRFVILLLLNLIHCLCLLITISISLIFLSYSTASEGGNVLFKFSNCFVTDVKIIKSKKGKQLILYKKNPYSFSKYFNTKKIAYWRCTSRTSRNCKATIFVDDYGNITCGIPAHTHSPPEYLVSDGQYIRVYTK